MAEAARRAGHHDLGHYPRVRANKTALTATGVSGLHRPRSHSLKRLPTTSEALVAPTHPPGKEGSGASETLESPLQQSVSGMNGHL